MKSKLFCAALALSLLGCAGVQNGLNQVQAGLSKVDQSTESAAEAFLGAVTAVKAVCDDTKDPEGCMAKLGLSDEVLDKVCVVGIGGDSCVAGAAADLDAAYREGTRAAAKAAEPGVTWNPT
jgi:hypothetical protein